MSKSSENSCDERAHWNKHETTKFNILYFKNKATDRRPCIFINFIVLSFVEIFDRQYKKTIIDKKRVRVIFVPYVTSTISKRCVLSV